MDKGRKYRNERDDETMSNVIWKYPLNFLHELNDIEMPKGSQVLTVDHQHGQVVMWVAVDPDAPKVHRRICIVPTGQRTERRLVEKQHIGTLLMLQGEFVIHIFDAGEF